MINMKYTKKIWVFFNILYSCKDITNDTKSTVESPHSYNP